MRGRPRRAHRPPPDRRPLRRAFGPDPARIQAGAPIVIAFAAVLFLPVQARLPLISRATAIILFSLMSDAIDTIGRLRIGPLRTPTWLAGLAALALVSGLLLTLSAIILGQVNTVVLTAIAHADQSQRAIAALFGWMGERVEAALLASMQTVEISGCLRTAAGQAGRLLSATVPVILFVTFRLVARIWFGAKLTALFGDPARAQRVSRDVAAIIHRVNRSLLVKTAVSAASRALIYGVARSVELDLALAIAILTFVLNFIPSVGSIIAPVPIGLVACIELGAPAPAPAVLVICGGGCSP